MEMDDGKKFNFKILLLNILPTLVEYYFVFKRWAT